MEKPTQTAEQSIGFADQFAELEHDIADLVRREITIQYRLDWARKQHRRRKHLTRAQEAA